MLERIGSLKGIGSNMKLKRMQKNLKLEREVNDNDNKSNHRKKINE